MFNTSVFQGSETYNFPQELVICTTPASVWPDGQDYPGNNCVLAAQGDGKAECTGLLGELGKNWKVIGSFAPEQKYPGGTVLHWSTQALAVDAKDRRNGFMTETSATAVQISQEPLLTRTVKWLTQHQSPLTFPGAPLNLHYTTSSRTWSRVGFLQSTDYILLPPTPKDKL